MQIESRIRYFCFYIEKDDVSKEIIVEEYNFISTHIQGDISDESRYTLTLKLISLCYRSMFLLTNGLSPEQCSFSTLSNNFSTHTIIDDINPISLCTCTVFRILCYCVNHLELFIGLPGLDDTLAEYFDSMVLHIDQSYESLCSKGLCPLFRQAQTYPNIELYSPKVEKKDSDMSEIISFSHLMKDLT